jgi:hypothetical protein
LRGAARQLPMQCSANALHCRCDASKPVQGSTPQALQVTSSMHRKLFRPSVNQKRTPQAQGLMPMSVSSL